MGDGGILAKAMNLWERLLEALLGPSPAKMMREAMTRGLAEGLMQWRQEMEQEQHNGFMALPNALALLREVAQRWRETYDVGQTEDGRYYIFDHALGKQAVLPFDGPDTYLLASLNDGTFQRPLLILEVAE